ncbi:hypothetical protein EV361DRAFT_950176 [Lentinula raphanica]|nr:hypothetical protein EV361DRAFT_950176 [Lentinula raphanica]
MRSRIIYAFYIAIPLLGFASVSASPLPAGTQLGQPANSAEDLPVITVHVFRIGLYDPIDRHWVSLDANKADRDKAMFALCITNDVCLCVDNSESEERIIEIEPKFTSDSADLADADSAPSQLRPRTQLLPRQATRFLDPDYYEKLDLGLFRSRFNLGTPRSRRESLVNSLTDIQELKKWLREEPKTFADGKPFVLAILSFLNSKKLLGRSKPQSSPTFQALYSETAVLLDSLKADATDNGFSLLATDRAYRRKHRQARVAAKTMTTAKHSSDQADSSDRGSKLRKTRSGESSASRNPLGNATKKKQTVALRLGLFNTIDGQWVVPTAGEKKPHDAEYALCISSTICPYYDSNIQGHVGHAAPVRYPNSSHVQSRYYKSLDVGLLFRRYVRRDFDKELKQWRDANSKKFFDGPSLILAILDWLESDGALHESAHVPVHVNNPLDCATSIPVGNLVKQTE